MKNSYQESVSSPYGVPNVLGTEVKYKCVPEYHFDPDYEPDDDEEGLTARQQAGMNQNFLSIRVCRLT
jgi:hypothetical protein